ncbi:related to exportin T (tRNA exportin) [Cephalotrichum gorgonifer]|uniref:Exportin-T n=1 Tax=Cephalotrichum gorgonifer TaxID=2041049 RepID=A0AAE8MV49_9PEZI|nr:related to exportin T (tRNA exportin) [Cephalotrichum gorgonifer]
MEAEIENAVEIAWNPSSEQSLKLQAYEYLNQIRSGPHAWQPCLNLFVRQSPRASEVVRMVCLEVVNAVIHSQGLDTASLTYIKDTLLEYSRRTYGQNVSPDLLDQPHLQNKLCQTLTYLFVFLYKDGWQSFVDDIYSLTTAPDGAPRDHAAGVVFYLRVLGSIHDEIADMLLSRNQNDAKRNVDLKDQIRAQDMGKIAQTWKELLAHYQNQNDQIVEMLLRLIGKWVSWMDISLIVSEEFLNMLLPLVGRANQSGSEDKVRDAAVDTLTEIAGKKMKNPDKMHMIGFLNLREIVSQLVASPPLNEFKSTPRYDTDLAEAVAKLVNTVMADVVRVLEAQVDDETRSMADRHLHDFIPFLLRFFSDEYDEVCSTVIPSLTDLLTAFRKIQTLPATYSEMLPPILNAIIMKMRFDETSTWGDQDEQTDEAEFQELRKRLQVLQKTVATVDQNLFLEVVSNLVANTFQTLDQQGSQMDWRDLDLALHEMYLFGELAMPSQAVRAKNEQPTAASERLAVMVKKMVESGIASYNHPSIIIPYMEICVRYAAVFDAYPEHIGPVLENFVRLVHHDHVRIKARSWYLFFRFVKQMRPHVGNITETVIQSISDLLPIQAEAPDDENDDDMSSDEQDNSEAALFTSQLYLYEAIGYISSAPSTPADQQALYVRSVMNNLFSDMEAHLPRAKSGDAQAVNQIHHIVMALGMLAHGFSEGLPATSAASGPGQPKRPAPAKAVSDEFSRAAEAILVALSSFNSSFEIRTACRSAFSRLLGVLGSAVLPQLPQWIEGLLSQSSSKDEMAFFLRILDQVVYEFKGEIYEVLNLLLTPLQQRIFTGLSEPASGTDDHIQLGELRREYLSFILVILNNNLEGTLVSETNQGFLENMITCIITLGRSFEGNPQSSKIAFGVMARMAAIWGGPDVAGAGGAASGGGVPAPTIPGFDNFMIERFHGVCWEVIQDAAFKPEVDAQTRQVLTEIAALEQVIYRKTGEVFIAHLRGGLIPSLGGDGDEFLRGLTGGDKKALSNYLFGLIKSRRG